jgi:enoyl-CoA hydratase
VRAVIIDKDNAPRWHPPALADVADADVEHYFAPLGADELVLQ